jgi:hypothetical protein
MGIYKMTYNIISNHIPDISPPPDAKYADMSSIPVVTYKDISAPPIITKRAAKRHRQRINKLNITRANNSSVNLKQKLKQKLNTLRSKRLRVQDQLTHEDIIQIIQTLQPETQQRISDMVQTGKIKDLLSLQQEVELQKSLQNNK